MGLMAGLLDEVKSRCGIPSDNVLAQRLGVTRAVVSAWRVDMKPMPDERIAQLCALAKLDGPTWMAKIHAERAESPAEKALWRSVLDRLSAAAAIIPLVVLGHHLGVGDALGAALPLAAATPDALCIMRSALVIAAAAWILHQAMSPHRRIDAA